MIFNSFSVYYFMILSIPFDRIDYKFSGCSMLTKYKKKVFQNQA